MREGNGLELAARDDAFPTTGALLAFRIAWLGADLPISLVRLRQASALGGSLRLFFTPGG